MSQSKSKSTLKKLGWFVVLYGLSLLVVGGVMYLGHLLARFLA